MKKVLLILFGYVSLFNSQLILCVGKIESVKEVAIGTCLGLLPLSQCGIIDIREETIEEPARRFALGVGYTTSTLAWFAAYGYGIYTTNPNALLGVPLSVVMSTDLLSKTNKSLSLLLLQSKPSQQK